MSVTEGRPGRPAAGLGVTREAERAIRFGMRLDQVAAVLGVQPGSYRTAPVHLDMSSPEAREHQQAFDNIAFDIDFLAGKTWYKSEYWEGNAGTIWVCLKEGDRVVAKAFIPARP